MQVARVNVGKHNFKPQVQGASLEDTDRFVQKQGWSDGKLMFSCVPLTIDLCRPDSKTNAIGLPPAGSQSVGPATA